MHNRHFLQTPSRMNQKIIVIYSDDTSDGDEVTNNNIDGGTGYSNSDDVMTSGFHHDRSQNCKKNSKD